MPADAKLALLAKETAESPTARRGAPQQQPERPAAIATTPEKASQSPRRRWVRWALFTLLPLALIAGSNDVVSPKATADAIAPAFLFLAACEFAALIAIIAYRREPHGQPMELD